MKPISSPLRIGAMVLLALASASCATPETRVRDGLMRAGLSRPMAACMAKRMVDRLSLTQLRRLDQLASLRDGNARDLTAEQFLHRARALGDPETLAVMTTSAGICALRR